MGAWVVYKRDSRVGRGEWMRRSGNEGGGEKKKFVGFFGEGEGWCGTGVWVSFEGGGGLGEGMAVVDSILVVWFGGGCGSQVICWRWNFVRYEV